MEIKITLSPEVYQDQVCALCADQGLSASYEADGEWVLTKRIASADLDKVLGSVEKSMEALSLTSRQRLLVSVKLYG